MGVLLSLPNGAMNGQKRNGVIPVVAERNTNAFAVFIIILAVLIFLDVIRRVCIAEGQ